MKINIMFVDWESQYCQNDYTTQGNLQIQCESEVAQSCPTLCNPMKPIRLLRPWDFPGKSTGVGCHFLLWCNPFQITSGIFHRTRIKNLKGYMHSSVHCSIVYDSQELEAT